MREWRHALGGLVVLVALGVCLCVPSVPAHHYTYKDGITPDPPPNSNDSDDFLEDKCTGANTSPSPAPGTWSAGEPINLFNGSFFHQHTDLSITARIPLEVTRYYDVQRDFKGLIGYGWSISYHIRLWALDNGSLLIKHGNNHRSEYRPIPGAEGRYLAVDSYETLSVRDDGTTAWQRKGGRVYQFDRDGCLARIQDPTGYELLFSYRMDADGSKRRLPFSGTSPYALLSTPITLGYDYQLTRVVETRKGVPTGRYLEFSYNDQGRILRLTDSAGREIRYDYDPQGTGDLLAVTDPEGNRHTFTYDANHRLTSFTGSPGCGVCQDLLQHFNAYDARGRVIRQTHGNHVIEFAYLADRRTKVTTKTVDDQTGKLLQTRYEYYDFNSKGRTIKWTRQIGSTLDETSGPRDDIVYEYEYNDKGLLTQERGRVGTRPVRRDLYTYDPNSGNLLSHHIVNPQDESQEIVTTYEYRDNRHPDRYTGVEQAGTTDPQRFRMEYAYDDQGRITAETRYADVNDAASALVSRYTYDESGDLVAVTDPRGHVKAYAYDDHGNPTRAYDPCDPRYETRWTYDQADHPVAQIDAHGNTTRYETDRLGRTTRTTNSLGESTILSFAGAKVTRVETGKTADGPGRMTLMDYDNQDRLVRRKALDAVGQEVVLEQTAYDSEGNVLSTRDALGLVTRYAYDVLGRLITITGPDGSTTQYTYDALEDRPATMRDGNGNVTSYVYDYAGRLISVTNANGHTTSYVYNAIDGVTAITDGKGQTTRYAYDGAGRLIREVNPCGDTTEYGYDANGNLVSKITANEHADPTGADPIVYTYDVRNQLVETAYPDDGSVRYTYDFLGNVVGWADTRSGLSQDVMYDPANRPLQVMTHYPGFSKAVGYAYDRFGDRVTMIDGEGRLTRYEYDYLGRPTTITHPGNLVTSYAYDLSGRRTAKILPNGVRTTYSYDPAGNLTSLVNEAPGGSALSFYGYTYDKAGNRLSMTTAEGKHAYAYDKTYQLTRATHPGPQPGEAYTYDQVGNRLTSAEYDNWTYDACNRLLSHGNTTFNYDRNGNTTRKVEGNQATGYAWDQENRLIRIQTPSHDIRYAYDVSWKRMCQSIGSIVTWSLYDHEDVIAQYDEAGMLIATHLHGPGADEPLAVATCSSTEWYLLDGLGSMTGLVNDGGSLLVSQSYTAFGIPAKTAGSDSRYMFTCRAYDSALAVYHYRARYYDPSAGRFLGSDPLPIETLLMGGRQGWDRLAEDPVHFNRYVYARNAPIDWADPLGYQASKCCPDGRPDRGRWACIDDCTSRCLPGWSGRVDKVLCGTIARFCRWPGVKKWWGCDVVQIVCAGQGNYKAFCYARCLGGCMYDPCFFRDKPRKPPSLDDVWDDIVDRGWDKPYDEFGDPGGRSW